MRSSSQILIFIDVQKALSAGIKFYLSDNGVVLTAGNDKGFLPPEFFSRVETADRKPLSGWDGPESAPISSGSAKLSAAISTGDIISPTPAAGGAAEEDGGPQPATAAEANSIEELEEKVQATTL